ncbi:MAG: hypothetical protein ACXABO_06585 [Promethearchaeota archaeon]|jgi:hypothetical protein
MLIEYNMMDKELFLCRCMHGGPILKKDLGKTVPNVSEEIVKQIFNAAIAKYGSCAVLAIDSELHNAVIGLLFFYPKVFYDVFNEAHPCIQDQKELNKIRANLDKIISAPSFDELKEKDKILCIECMQVVGKSGKVNIYSREDPSNNRKSIEYKPYTSQGIGDGMLTKLISWAREFGWKKVQSTAIPDVKPLRMWWGNQSLNGFLKRGFTLIKGSEELHEEVLEAISSMKKGFHGKKIQQMWREYENLTDKELITSHRVELVL